MTDDLDRRLSVPTDRYDRIAARIGSDASPVGIDARATHVAILHLLLDVQDRLARIEARLGMSLPDDRP